MFFWGWGTRVQKWILNEHQTLVASWKYFHIFWFPAAGTIHWTIIGDVRSEDREITYEEVKRLVPLNPPRISIWKRFGLFFLLAALVLLVIYLSLTDNTSQQGS